MCVVGGALRGGRAHVCSGVAFGSVGSVGRTGVGDCEGAAMNAPGALTIGADVGADVGAVVVGSGEGDALPRIAL